MENTLLLHVFPRNRLWSVGWMQKDFIANYLTLHHETAKWKKENLN
jgi:hypothetical protein